MLTLLRRRACVFVPNLSPQALTRTLKFQVPGATGQTSDFKRVHGETETDRAPAAGPTPLRNLSHRLLLLQLAASAQRLVRIETHDVIQ